MAQPHPLDRWACNLEDKEHGLSLQNHGKRLRVVLSLDALEQAATKTMVGCTTWRVGCACGVPLRGCRPKPGMRARMWLF